MSDCTTLLLRQRRKFEREKKEALDQQLFKILKSQAKTMEKVLREHKQKHESLLESERLKNSLREEELHVASQRAQDECNDLKRQCKMLSAKLTALRGDQEMQNKTELSGALVKVERSTRRVQSLEERLKREAAAKTQWQVMADEMKSIIMAQQQEINRLSRNGASSAVSNVTAETGTEAAGPPPEHAEAGGTGGGEDVRRIMEIEEAANAKVEAAQAAVTRLENQLEAMEMERDTLGEQLQVVQAELEKTTEEQTAKVEEYDRLLRAQHNALKKELDLVKEHFKAQAAPIVDAARRSKRQLSAVRRQCEALTTKVREQESLGIQKDKLVHEMSTQLEQLETRHAALRKEVASGKHSAAAQHSAELEALKAEMSVMQERLDIAEDDRQAAEQTAQELEQELRGLRSNPQAAGTKPTVPPRVKRTQEKLRRRSEVFRSQVERHVEETAHRLRLEHADALALQRRQHATQVQELLSEIQRLQEKASQNTNKELLNAADVEELAKFREARARRTHYLARGAADNVFKPMLARAVKTMSNRRRFVQEFFTTERTYVEGVALMCEDYVDKLVAQTNSHTAAIAEDPSGTAVSEEVMPLDVIYGIFGNIREIFKIHARFFDRIKVFFDEKGTIIMSSNPHLSERSTGKAEVREGVVEDQFEWNGRRCSTVDEVLRVLLSELRRVAPDFYVYHNFLTNKEASSQLLNRWRNREPFRSLWMGLLQKSRGLGPESFLVMPVQRLPRYKMLLEAIGSAMPRYHPGRQLCDEVLGLIRDNLDSFQRHLNAEKLKRIQKKVSTASPRRVLRNISIFTPTKARTFVLDGFLEKRLPVGKQRQYVLLLSDKFLYGPSENSLRAVISLADASVYDAGEKTLILEERGDGKERHKFDAESSQEKEQWVDIIRETIGALSSSKAAAAEAEAAARAQYVESHARSEAHPSSKSPHIKHMRSFRDDPREEDEESGDTRERDPGDAGSGDNASERGSMTAEEAIAAAAARRAQSGGGRPDKLLKADRQSVYLDAVSVPEVHNAQGANDPTRPRMGTW